MELLLGFTAGLLLHDLMKHLLLIRKKGHGQKT